MDDPYVNSATQVLRNLRGISDAAVLEAAEREAAGLRDVVLKTHLLSGAYDLSHLQGFHRCLFQDIYAWAGKLRTVSIARDETLFCLPEHLEPNAQQIFDRLAGTSGLSREPAQAAVSLATVLGDVPDRDVREMLCHLARTELQAEALLGIHQYFHNGYVELRLLHDGIGEDPEAAVCGCGCFVHHRSLL